MKSRFAVPVLCALAAFGAGSAALASLAGYIQRPEGEYRWSKEAERPVGEVTLTTLKMRSQVWRGLPWDHRVEVYTPRALAQPRTALLYITGGDPGLTESLLGATLASRLGARVAILYNIPNQPLFDGKSEDDLIGHTFAEYLKTGDPTWPLLLPMAKSAVKAMDALQAYTKQEGAAPVERFVVTGASKRGWTTWLTAASDPRVRGIAPMVFDNLNFGRQMPRQRELWGRYSEQIEDYTRRGLQQQMDTPRGKELVAMVDPWHYRQRLEIPKLLINGANDRYWSTDATRLYWDDLRGEKYLLSVPNAGHGLEDRTRVLNTLAAFFQAVAAERPLPGPTARQERSNGKVTVRLTSPARPREARLWTARAPDLDFRPARWQSTPLRAEGNAFVGEVELPAAGGVAVFTEAEYERDGRTFTLSTPAEVYGTRPTAAGGK